MSISMVCAGFLSTDPPPPTKKELEFPIVNYSLLLFKRLVLLYFDLLWKSIFWVFKKCSINIFKTRLLISNLKIRKSLKILLNKCFRLKELMWNNVTKCLLCQGWKQFTFVIYSAPRVIVASYYLKINYNLSWCIIDDVCAFI